MSIPKPRQMTHICIENLSGKTLVVSDHSRTLLEHFEQHRLDWMHACGKKGRCTTCKAIVLQGMEHFAGLTPAEERYRSQGALAENERLSCQARISGDVTVAVPSQYQLPHMKYSD